MPPPTDETADLQQPAGAGLQPRNMDQPDYIFDLRRIFFGNLGGSDAAPVGLRRPRHPPARPKRLFDDYPGVALFRAIR